MSREGDDLQALITEYETRETPAVQKRHLRPLIVSMFAAPLIKFCAKHTFKEGAIIGVVGYGSLTWTPVKKSARAADRAAERESAAQEAVGV